jgi:hypothetical protein
MRLGHSIDQVSGNSGRGEERSDPVATWRKTDLDTMNPAHNPVNSGLKLKTL